MKVFIQVWGEGEYEQDTLESRIVDSRINDLQKEFAHNGIETEVVRTDKCREMEASRT